MRTAEETRAYAQMKPRNDGRRAIDKQRAVQHYSDQQKIAECLASMKSIYAMSQPHSRENPWGLADSPESFRAHVESISGAAISKLEPQS